jgi:hypothetical protein
MKTLEINRIQMLKEPDRFYFNQYYYFGDYKGSRDFAAIMGRESVHVFDCKKKVWLATR